MNTTQIFGVCLLVILFIITIISYIANKDGVDHTPPEEKGSERENAW